MRMKRPPTDGSRDGDRPIAAVEEAGKRRKIGDPGEEAAATGRVEMGEDLLFEVLRHADAGTLARAACVSRAWRRTAEDERLWEGVCTRHWRAHMGCGVQQLRAVVLALGGFRRLFSLYLLPILKPSSSSSSAAAAPVSPHPLLPAIPSLPSSSSSASFPAKTAAAACLPARWGKDEMHLSLSLLSIKYYYDKMNLSKR